MTTKTTEGRMPAFTEEQIKILKAAFDHTSQRIWASQCELSRMYDRLSALGDVLEEKDLVGKFHVLLECKQGYDISMIWEPDTMDFKFDRVFRHRILEGDLSASERCFEQEREALRARQAESYKEMCSACRSREGDWEVDNLDICELASKYDGGQYIYNPNNPKELWRARVRCQEEWAKQKPNATCACCEAKYYSEDAEEHRRILTGDGAAVEAAQQPKE